MKKRDKQFGFSLTEVLIATAILAVGLMMIAMAFPVGVKLTSIATERTIGAVAANEAFAKFQLYIADPNGDVNCSGIPQSRQVNLPEIAPLMLASELDTLLLPVTNPDSNSIELWYPSVVPVKDKKYHWSVLARRTGTNELQLTAFVTRLMDGAAGYYDMVGAQATPFLGWPVPVIVNVGINPADANEVKVDLTSPLSYKSVAVASEILGFFTEGCTIVDDLTGDIYRVVELKDSDAVIGNETLVLNRQYYDQNGDNKGLIWVVPPAVGSTRNPCIAVQQRIVRF